jgi:hypothetical protein
MAAPAVRFLDRCTAQAETEKRAVTFPLTTGGIMRLIGIAHRVFNVVAFLLLCVAITWLATGGRVFAATATITWQNATQRVDGTVIAAGELTETLVEYGKCVAGNAFPPTADGTKSVAFPGATVDITGLTYGTWCFRARHKDSTGLFSDYAGPVWKAYVAPPKPPTILTVQGIVWEMRLHPVDGPYLARVIGTVEAGKACRGLAPAIGFDIFTIDPNDAKLDRKLNPNGTAVAQCAIIEG